MHKITVRQANRKDLPEMIKLYLGFQEYKGILPDKLIAPRKEKDLIPYLSGTNPNRKYIVASSGKDELLGVCYLDLAFTSMGNVRIGDFIVNKEDRHKGIGRKMLKYAISYCKKKKIKKMWLWTQEELKEAIQFYKANNFVIEGKQKSQFAGKDALLLGLVL